MTRIFVKAPENAQTSLDRACDILYFVLSADCGHILYRLLLAARFEAALMLRCEKPHRPAAYEPILVRLPQVFGAALLHWEKKRQYFSVILLLNKTASLFLGIFSILFLSHGMIIRLAPKQARQPVFHVKAGTASIREDAPDAPLVLSHPP